MRLVFMGTSTFAVPSLSKILAAGHDVAAVVTRPDGRAARSATRLRSAVKQVALSRALPLLEPESAGDKEFARRLNALAPEVFVVAAYGQILPPAVLAIPPRWSINVHASLLPRWRGAAPIARAIMAGDRVTGVTTMKMDKGLDTGDILLQRECAIGLGETAGALSSRLADLGADLIVETLADHARGALEPRRQDPREATQAPPLTKMDGRIDWAATCDAIARRVRGCNPWPVAFTYLRGQPVQILEAEESFEPAPSGASAAAPGQVIAADAARVIVQCQGGTRLAILRVRFPGGRAIAARDAVNGRLLRIGDTFAQAPGS